MNEDFVQSKIDLSHEKARRRAKARKSALNLTCRPETKTELRKWANELFFDSISDLVEFLCTKHRQGLLFITENQDFFAGMARSLEKVAEAKAAEVAEKTTLDTLADRGFISSPYRK